MSSPDTHPFTGPTGASTGIGAGPSGEPGVHPVLEFMDSMAEGLKSVADLNPAFMTINQKRDALLGLTDLISEVEALRMRVIAASDDVAEADGSPNVAAWLTPRTHTKPTSNHATEKLARSLDSRWSQVHDALSRGSINVEQAKTIVTALDRVAAGDVPDHVLAQAEAHLIELAGRFAPDELRIAGRKILSVVAPDLVEDEERKRLEEEERKANAKSRLVIRKKGDGTADLHATMSEASAARLKGVLDSMTAPRVNNDPTTAPAPLTDPATGKKIPFDQRRGMALEAFLEGLDPEALPVHGGNGTTLVITMELGDLLAGTGAATLPDGSRISAGQARRLACTSKLVPAVLDGTSEVLDYGRGKRLFTGTQIAAMGVRDKTCRADGCLMPARWCEAHHFTQSWADGGKTDIKDGKLLCPFHHRCAHDDTYDRKLLPNGDVRFHKRT